MRIDWEFLRGPVTLTFAVAIAGMIGYLLAPTAGVWQIKISWTIITIGVVLDITLMERVLVKATLRAAGTLIGALIGLGIVAIYTGLQTGSALTADIWLWLSVAGVACVLALLMQFAGENAYIYHLTSITVVIVAYSGEVLVAVGRFISVLAGIAIAMISILIFCHEPTHKRVSRYYEVAVTLCFRLLSETITVSTDAENSLIPELRMALFNAEDALEARKKWRGWFRLREEPEMDALSESVVNLYHECHSCSITARIIDLHELVTEQDVSLVFQPILKRFSDLLRDLATELPRMHDISLPNTVTFTHTVEQLADVIAALNVAYLDNLEGILTPKALGRRFNSIMVVLAVTVISLAQYCSDSCTIPTLVRIDPVLLLDIKSRLELVQTNVRLFLKSGPAILHFKDIANR